MQKKHEYRVHRVGLIGAGRMGEQILKIAQQNHQSVIQVRRSSSQHQWEELKNTDVWLDFALAEGFMDRYIQALIWRKPIVVGTTGLHAQMSEIKRLCQKHNGSVVISSNFSLGVHLFLRASRQVYQQFQLFPLEFEAQIEEIHHRGKKDAPSGTALMLQEKLLELSETPVAVQSERIDEVTGIHRLKFTTSYDQLVIEHQAVNRECFAKGALLAADWLITRSGFFTFDDVVDDLLASEC